jgi:DNA-binding NarL/FixJ family response regulator
VVVDAFAPVEDTRPVLAAVSWQRTSVEILASDPVLRAGVESALRRCREVTTVQDGTPSVTVIAVDTVDEQTLRLVRDTRAASRRGILLVATSADATGTLRAIEAGVSGVLRRREASAEGLTAAVLAVAGGHGSMPPDLLGEVMERLGRLEGNLPGRHPASVLDDREKAVLRMVADGHETAEIARALAYSPRTVTGIVHDITHRLRLRNRAHAVAYALREGLI